MVNVADAVKVAVNGAVNVAIKTWIEDYHGLENYTGDSSPDHATTVSIDIMATTAKSASLSPIHDHLSTTNANQHCNLRHRSSLSGPGCGNCLQIVACGVNATVIDYSFHDILHCNTAVTEDDKKKA